MRLEQVEYGQRVRVNMPGVGDHGKAGIIKRVRGLNCYVHLDWDQRPERQVVFSAARLDLEPTEPAQADVTRRSGMPPLETGRRRTDRGNGGSDGGYMSMLVAAGQLSNADIFESQNGSAYIVANHTGPGGTAQARLWCAHVPDTMTFDPPLIDLPSGQEVRVLKGDEAEVHYTHPGYVEHVFRTEMDRRHNTMMGSVYEKSNREDAAQRHRLRANRPWWKKLLG